MEKVTSDNSGRDVTGQNKIAGNVLFSWGSYIVFFVSGFIMPRMMDHYVGQASLGVWDFCWAFINYLNLTSLGVGSAVSRYVATYRAQQNMKDLREIISSVICIQFFAAILVIALTAALTLTLPAYFSSRLGAGVSDAQWVVALLGASYAVQTLFDVSRGVLTGYHCWGLFNSVMSLSRLLSVAGMVIALMMNGGLRSLAAVYLLVRLATELLRMRLALGVCGELRFRPEYVSLPAIRKMFSFGVRTVLADLPSIIVIQTGNILLLSSLGPAALAVFSRPMALVRHIQAFQNKFSYVLTPTVGSLIGTGRIDELRSFFIEYSRYGVVISLPFYIFLAVFGDQILYLWMGADYISPGLTVFLSCGYFLPVSQNVSMRVLIGMNAHGRAALWSLIISVAVFIVGAFVLSAAGWTLSGAALLSGLSLTLGQGIFVPVFCCRKLKIPVLRYICFVFPAPLLCGAGLLISLLITRFYFGGQGTPVILAGLLNGGIVFGFLVWFLVLKIRHRKLALSFFSKFFFRSSESEGT